MTDIAPHITAFLRQRLQVERAASPHTQDTYAYAFQLLFGFASRKLRVPPSALQLEQIDGPLVLKFLEDLQSSRGNGTRTRNARLTAIKSFMHFVEHRMPSALEQIKRVLSIPYKKTDVRLVNHLTTEQCQAILDAPDPTTRLGIRDRTMLHLAVTAGLRVSELVGLHLDEVSFQSRYVDVHVRGKGRKDRLWAAAHKRSYVPGKVMRRESRQNLGRQAPGSDGSAHNYLPLSEAMSLSAGRKEPRFRVGGRMASSISRFCEGSARRYASVL